MQSLIYTQLKTGSKQRLETNEDSSAERMYRMIGNPVPSSAKNVVLKKKKKKRVDAEHGHKVRLDQINGLVHCATEEPEHDSLCQVLKEALSGGINSVRVHSARV